VPNVGHERPVVAGEACRSGSARRTGDASLGTAPLLQLPFELACRFDASRLPIGMHKAGEAMDNALLYGEGLELEVLCCARGVT